MAIPSELAAQLEPHGGTLLSSKAASSELAPPHLIVHASLRLETSQGKASTGAASLRWVSLWWVTFCSMLSLAMSYLPDV